MKKIFFMNILMIILIIVLVGCSNKTKESNLPIGNYLMEESEEIIKPILSLKDNNKYHFNYSPLSSYYNCGSYKELDGNLILGTDDGNFKYIFKIKGNKLIFNEKESSKIASYAKIAGGPFEPNVIDGSIFSLTNDKFSEIESLAGYIVVKDNTIHFDEVEIVEAEDKERIKELDLDENLQPTGFEIYNEIQEEVTLVLADEVDYTFTDVYLNFIKESQDNRVYHTRKIEEFLKHLGEYNLNDIQLFEQTIPYFIEVQDGKVISITEQFKFTI